MLKVYYVWALLGFTLFFSCADAPSGDIVETGNAVETDTDAPKGESYHVSKGSTVNWYGASPTHGQNGAFNIDKGNLIVDNGMLTGGEFEMKLADMQILSAGLPKDKQEKLREHLLSPDFFDTTVNQLSKFVITKVEPVEGDENATHLISGNLTLKDSTKNVTFPAKVNLNETLITAEAKFTINRKDWGLNYKNDESLGDEWIYDKVEMSINLSAAK